jgi:hypothetical protein
MSVFCNSLGDNRDKLGFFNKLEMTGWAILFHLRKETMKFLIWFFDRFASFEAKKLKNKKIKIAFTFERE